MQVIQGAQDNGMKVYTTSCHSDNPHIHFLSQDPAKKAPRYHIFTYVSSLLHS